MSCLSLTLIHFSTDALVHLLEHDAIVLLLCKLCFHFFDLLDLHGKWQRVRMNCMLTCMLLCKPAASSTSNLATKQSLTFRLQTLTLQTLGWEHSCENQPRIQHPVMLHIPSAGMYLRSPPVSTFWHRFEHQMRQLS